MVLIVKCHCLVAVVSLALFLSAFQSSPTPPDSQMSQLIGVSRAAVQEANLEVIYQMRNRLAHHEVVYGARFMKLVEEICFRVHELDNRPNTGPSPLEELLTSDIEACIEWHGRIEKMVEGIDRDWR